ncbi:MAG TPA: 50S ribosomal protein L17 [Candidatus Paceibacterota bacterium]|nr:50S ribosomal protein L17 [Candidatus Paceibacterota bacterium]HOL53873.1 50S ribosomal protein L17 [Candidatus Paceibacterota bacterium]HPP16788.1 50S ribosomal protein L17 [Candidatus Paceibacterota bacterium]
MRHLNKGRKFGRTRGDRKLFMKSLIANLIMNKKIETTEARARELKVQTEKLVTLAKKQTLAAYRLLISRIGEKPAKELFYNIAPKLQDRKGGYIRIVKSPRRRKRDGAPVAIVEFVL